MHIVHFDESGRIAQIRQQWDQGSLLKQMEIIGKSGRNWPIRDNRDQLTLIQNCLKSTGFAPPKQESHNDVVNRTRGSSNNAMRDPHATLHLFGSREEIESAAADSVVNPYAGGHRRGQRSFADVLGDEPTGEHYDDAHRERSMSPSKVGQGKNIQPMRIFEGQEHIEEEDETPKNKRNTYIRPDPSKYNHFDFADGSDPQDKPKPGVAFDERPKSKHDSQWSFADFVTPQKAQPSKVFRHQDARHWDTEASNVEGDDGTPNVGKGRRDAETHFELQDDGERLPHQDRAGAHPRGGMPGDKLGLNRNKLFDQDDSTPEPQRALGNITNLSHRGKDFDPHFNMTDESPAPNASRSQNVPDAHKKAVKMMDANWSSYDKSPAVQKENQSRSEARFLEDNKINIAGDGMGGRKGTNRNWLYGEDDDEELPKPTSRKGNSAAATASQKSHWGF